MWSAWRCLKRPKLRWYGAGGSKGSISVVESHPCHCHGHDMGLYEKQIPSIILEERRSKFKSLIMGHGEKNLDGILL